MADAMPNEPVAAVPAAKAKEEFRVYKKEGGWSDNVFNHYRMMRQNQTLAFVERMEAKYFPLRHAKMTVREAFDALADYVDSSDPDLSLPNAIHAFQTAEAMRAAGEPDWMQLLGLIHDIGKLMYRWGTAEEGQVGTAEGPQFALGGDTWVVGARIPDCTVYPELNGLNPDQSHPVYGTENGIYTPGCGIMALRFAFGHDEYAYRLLLDNGLVGEGPNQFPPIAAAIVRLHSCYPWHRGGAYKAFEAPGDEAIKTAVLHFNNYDLYTKSPVTPVPEQLWPYYQTLVDKYMPGKLDW